MATFLPQAQFRVPQNAMLNLQPLNDALDSNRRNAMLDRQFTADQEHRQATLGMQREQLDMRRQEFDQNQQQAIRQRFGSLARMVELETDPAKRREMWTNVLRLHPQASSLDPSFRDPTNGPRLLMAEAGIVVDPLERQTAEARLGLIGAQTDQARAAAARAHHEMRNPQLPPGEEERIKAMARAQGKAQGEAIVDLPRVEATAERIISQIEAIENDPRLSNVTGWQASFPTLNPRNVDTEERIAQLGGAAFLQAFESLKGGGQITEVEGRKATDALARLTNLRQSDEGFREALADFKREVAMLVDIARRRAGAAPAQPSQQASDNVEATRTVGGQTYVKIGGQWYAQ